MRNRQQIVSLFCCVLVPLGWAGSARPIAAAPVSNSSSPKGTIVKKPTKTRAASPTKPAVKPAVKAPQAYVPQPEAKPLISTNTRTWALLVGVSKYQNPRISSLKYPAADVTAMSESLVSPEIGGVPSKQVRLLVDEQATSANILGAVDDFLKPNVKPGDQVIIFLAGHGIAKGVGPDARGYFLATDTSGVLTPALEASAVNLKSFSAKLGTLPAAQFVLFVDACREDPTPGRGLKPNPLSDIMSRGLNIVGQDAQKPPDVLTFFACTIGQRAYEDPELKHGVFTYWILDGLKRGPVAAAPDGRVDMGVLSGYVSQKVSEWARKTSGGGRSATLATGAVSEEDEVQQTPEIIGSDGFQEPVILMHVKRKLNVQPVPAEQSKLIVTTFPEGAQVSMNGKRVGASPALATLSGGASTLRIEAPGYQAIEVPVRVPGGYQVQMNLQLKPASRGVTAGVAGGIAAGNERAAGLYDRALEAEARQQTEMAMAGYQTVLEADPTFAPAYEHLAGLQLRSGNKLQAAATLKALVGRVPSAHTYSLLAQTYAEIAQSEKNALPIGAANAPTPKSDSKVGGVLGGLFGKKKTTPTNPKTAAPSGNALLALQAATQAMKMAPESAEAYLAQGYALSAADRGGQNKTVALAAFGKSAFLDATDAASQLGLGYGIRIFAAFATSDAAREAEVRRAIAPLREALKLRPNFYEAHRELAYCYHLLGETQNAMHQYEQANANRGAATDPNEVSGQELALSGLHRQQAQESSGVEKQQQEAAADGYLEDAKETTPSLTKAMGILSQVGLGTSLTDYLPPQMRILMDPGSAIRGEINNRIPGFLLPGLRF